MNKKYLINSVLGISGIFIGLMISFQIFSPEPVVTNPWEQITELDQTVQILNTSHNQLQSKISELRQEINNYEESAKRTEFTEKLEATKMQTGLTSISGKGVKILLDIKLENFLEDNPNTNYCFAADIRDVINLARAGEAKAIAINGQRVLSKTPIACFGSSILINNMRFLPPFTINVVTDNPEKLLSYMNTRKYLENIYEKIDANWVELIFEVKDKITAPVFAGSITPNYIQ